MPGNDPPASPVLLLVALLCTACAHSVRFTTEPPGARLSLDGSFVGYTPVTLDCNGAVREARIAYDGYRPVRACLRREFDASYGAWVVIPPWAFFPRITTRLGSHYHLDLLPGTAPMDIGIWEIAPDAAPSEPAP